MLAEIEDQILASSSARLSTILLSSQHTIEQLNLIIDGKLLRHKNGTSRARRRSWFSHKAKVMKLQSALQFLKDDLLTAVNVSNL